jgi:hypothetical protein
MAHHTSHTYHSLPANDEELKPLVIATSADQSVDREQSISNSSIAKRRRTFIVLLGLIFLYMAFWASKNVTWKGCRGALGLGIHRNISNPSIASDKFYQLPSGDKIPAVALGTLKS